MVDDEDYEVVSSFRWFAYVSGITKNYFRAARFSTTKNGQKKKMIHLPRFLLNAPDGMVVDHINGDTLDNRRSNLRICTTSENGMNATIGKRNTSGYKGVSGYPSKLRPWTAMITYQQQKVFIGNFDTKEEAALAYNKKAKEYFGEFARLNIIK